MVNHKQYYFEMSYSLPTTSNEIWKQGSHKNNTTNYFGRKVYLDHIFFAMYRFSLNRVKYLWPHTFLLFANNITSIICERYFSRKLLKRQIGQVQLRIFQNDKIAIFQPIISQFVRFCIIICLTVDTRMLLQNRTSRLIIIWIAKSSIH